MKIKEIQIDEKYILWSLYPEINSLSEDSSSILIGLKSENTAQTPFLFMSDKVFGVIGYGINGFEPICSRNDNILTPVADTVKILEKENVIGFHINSIKPAKGGGYISISVKYSNNISKSLFMLFLKSNHNWDEKITHFKEHYLSEFINFWDVNNEITQYDGYNC